MTARTVKARTVEARTLVERFRAKLDELGLSTGEDAPLVVALSGGLDSCVLLHLLRFQADPTVPLLAAHFDHAMRAGSDEDARWVAGLCLAWSVPLRLERAADPPDSEVSARTARYAFLERVGDEVDARATATAHHADDQAETVLFRALRGTGLEGLAGIPEERAPRLVRPLLGVWREELEAYASIVGLRWRDDPTNEQLGFARNVIRHELLPISEEKVAPGARRALVRLGLLAARNEEAWAEVLPALLRGLDARTEVAGDRTVSSVERASTLDLGEALRARVLRHLAADVGVRLDEATTRRAVEFTAAARSGGSVELGGGVTLRRELDRFAVMSVSPPPRDLPLAIPDLGPGSGDALIGGRAYRCSWVPGPHSSDAGFLASFALEQLAFPLVVRGREPGDRVRTAAGTRKLKKLLLEARTPPGHRDSVPVLADGSGRVLWVPGVVRTSVIDERGAATLTIGISG